MSQGRTFIAIEHDEIRRWVEKHGGTPATVKATEGKHGEPGILRIDFPGYTGEATLEPVSWNEFFEKFDEQKLAFLYQETTASGKQSNFNKFIKRPAELESGTSSAKSGSKKSSQVRSKTISKGAAKAVKTATKAGTRSRSQTVSRATAKPKASTQAKAAPKLSAKRKVASKAQARTTSRAAAQPKQKTKARPQAKSRARVRGR